MSHRHIQQLRFVRDEFEAAFAAVAFAERSRTKLDEEPEMQGIAPRQLRAALTNLEDTFLIRIFAEFEAILRDHLPLQPGRQDRRTAFDLINRAASRFRIPAPISHDVQTVREYRNLLAHRSAFGAQTVVFRDALSALNKFLAYLP